MQSQDGILAPVPAPPPVFFQAPLPADEPGSGLGLDAETARQWDALAERVGAAPSQRRLWMEPWWEAFGSGDLEIHSAMRAGQVTAILPVARRGRDLESTANFHTPSFEILAEDEGHALQVARQLFEGTPRRVSLTAVDEAGPTLRVCRQAAGEAGYRVLLRPHLCSPYLQADGPVGFQDRLGHNLRRNIRRTRRQLGPVTLETVTGGRDLDAWLAEAFRVEASGWKGEEGTAIVSRPHTRYFYSALAHRAAEAGMLRLFLLKSGRRTIAMCFALQAQGICSLLKGGYDEAFKRHSPSMLLLHDLIQESLARGVTRVELNGDADDYKRAWTNAEHRYVRFEAFAPTFAGSAARASFRYARPVSFRVRSALGLPSAGHRQ